MPTMFSRREAGRLLPHEEALGRLFSRVGLRVQMAWPCRLFSLLPTLQAHTQAPHTPLLGFLP